MRALRAGKESYAVIAATLAAFASGKHEEEIAIYRMMAAPLETLRDRANRIAAEVGGKVIETRAAIGGGTTPAETMPSIGIEIPGNPNAVHRLLLRFTTPVVATIREDRCILDMRTILEDEDAIVIAALRSLAKNA
jgi:L-seryl-tRNA(Ser) seleniumtransferase